MVARSGALVPDVERRMPGRGAHLHRDLGCLELAARRRAFPRALRVPGPLDDTAVREAVGVWSRLGRTAPGGAEVPEALG